MTLRWRRLAVMASMGIVAGVVALGTPAPASAAPGQGGKACASCHGQPDLATRTENGEQISLYVNPNAFSNSAHGKGGLGCTDCHSSLSIQSASVPSRDHPTSAPCQTCHTEPGRKPQSVGLVGKVAYPDAKSYLGAVAGSNASACQACHPNQSGSNGDKVHARYADSGRAPSCTACHSPHATEPTVAPFKDISARCVDCHRNLYDEKLIRVHGHASLAGGTDSATCAQCHGVHSSSSPAKPVAVLGPEAKQCATCHATLGTQGVSSLTSEVKQPNLLVLGGQIAVKGEPAHSDPAVRNDVQQACQSCHAERDLGFDGLRKVDVRTVAAPEGAGLWGDPVGSALAGSAVGLVVLYVGHGFIAAVARRLRRSR